MIYLASPYTHPDPAVRQRRFDAACRAAAQMIRAGSMVFSPVVHSHPLTHYGLPFDWRAWAKHRLLRSQGGPQGLARVGNPRL